MNAVVVIEVRRGKDGKLYPPRMPLPEAERNRARRAAHQLVCSQGLSLRAAQRVMREERGTRRSLGQIHADLRNFECADCAQVGDHG